MERLSWAEYGLAIADAVATRSEDPWVKVGAVIFRSDNTVASVGYNGAPSGMTIDWSTKEARDRHVIHAEVNALRFADASRFDGNAWMASTRHPCTQCLLAIRAYNILEIVWREPAGSDHEKASHLARELGINAWRVE